MAVALLMPLLTDAQTTAWVRNSDEFKVWQGGSDTLTNADTLTYTFPSVLSKDWEYNIQYVTDSLSGATAGTIKLWVSNDPDNEVWYQKETVTMNGATQQNGLWTGTFAYPKMKIVAISTGTMTSKVRFWWVIKAKH
jgi:hypothetical protein